VIDLDLRKLRYFVTIAESTSFRAAAARLRIAQPALSRQIRCLEGELGVTLFVRTARGVELTSAGTRLLQEARTLLQSSGALIKHARAEAS
jgi:DNA-binding transcriptional LysR family regulator